MKNIWIPILTLVGLLCGQAAYAWDWPFFGQKTEPALEASQVPTLTKEKDDAWGWRANNSFSEDRREFVVRSYARSFNFHGSSPLPISLDATNPNDLTSQLGDHQQSQGQSVGLIFQANDYAKAYVEYAGFNQTLDSPWLANSTINLALGFNIGAEINYQGFTAGVRYFQFDYSQKLLNHANLDSTLAVSRARDFNLPMSQAQGLELSASWALDKMFDWNFELRPYVYLTKFFERWSPAAWGSPGSWGGQRDSALRFSYGLVFNHEVVGLSMSLEALDNGLSAPFYYPLIGQDMAEGTIYNFHLVKRLYDWKDNRRLFFKADVTNIGDAQNNNKRSANEDGRTFKTSLRYEY
jgi:hypothetical protein